MAADPQFPGGRVLPEDREPAGVADDRGNAAVQHQLAVAVGARVGVAPVNRQFERGLQVAYPLPGPEVLVQDGDLHTELVADQP